MFLSDYHIHSTCSPDAFDTMAAMARASKKAGVSLVCFTDHCDLDWYETGKPDPHCFDYWPEALRQLREAKDSGGDLPELRLGIELGEAHHDPARAREIAERPELDFVLGSLHSLRDEPDFYCHPYESREHCEALMRRYLSELCELARLPFIDVVAHIGYTRRYMRQAGFDIRADMTSFGDELDAVLNAVIDSGHGIEVNTSGLRNEYVGETLPCAEVVSRYRELGGEIITLGSDAHRTEDAGAGLREGLELISAAGFRYFTVFRNRKAEFIKIQEV